MGRFRVDDLIGSAEKRSFQGDSSWLVSWEGGVAI